MKSEFTVRFTCDNAAFDPCPEAESARILLEIVGQLMEDLTDGFLHDINGNRVGEWCLNMRDDS